MDLRAKRTCQSWEPCSLQCLFHSKRLNRRKNNKINRGFQLRLLLCTLTAARRKSWPRFKWICLEVTCCNLRQGACCHMLADVCWCLFSVQMSQLFKSGIDRLSVQQTAPLKLVVLQSPKVPLEVLGYSSMAKRTMASNLLLQSRHGKCFDHSLGRLGLHDHLLAEHHPLASLGRCLLASLDHAQSWKSELARLLHLICADLSQRVQDLGNVRPLELSCIDQLTKKSSLWHCLLTLHGFHCNLLCLHRLCWGHDFRKVTGRKDSTSSLSRIPTVTTEGQGMKVDGVTAN